MDQSLEVKYFPDGGIELFDLRGYHVAKIKFNEQVDPAWRAKFLKNIRVANEMAEFVRMVERALQVPRNRFGKLEPTAIEFDIVRQLFLKHDLKPTIMSHGDMVGQIREIAQAITEKLDKED